MVTSKKKAKKKMAAPKPAVVIPVEPELITCPVCHGSKIQELNHGLLQFKCSKCNGEGKIRKPGSRSES